MIGLVSVLLGVALTAPGCSQTSGGGWRYDGAGLGPLGGLGPGLVMAGTWWLMASCRRKGAR